MEPPALRPLELTVNGLPAMTAKLTPTPAVTAVLNICTGNPQARSLFSQMAHPASMIMKSGVSDDASTNTNAAPAVTFSTSTQGIEQ